VAWAWTGGASGAASGGWGGGSGRGRWAYALVAFLYLATWPFHHGLNNPNEMVRVYMTKALVDHHSFAIDRVLGELGPVDDKAVRDGRLYSSKAPLESLLGAPVYAAFEKLETLVHRKGAPPPSKRAITEALRLGTSALPGLLFAALLLGWSRRRAKELGASEAAGTGMGLVLALGTMLYPYALTFTGHIWAAITAGGAYLAIAAMSRAQPGSRRWRAMAALAGLGAGAAPFAEYPAALMVLPALAAGLFLARPIPGVEPRPRALRFRYLAWLGASGALPFALGLWAHQELWGSPFKTGYAFLENHAYVEVHRSGFFGVGPPKLEAFGGALFSPGTGLFFYSPVLLLGLVAAFRAAVRSRWRRRPGDLPRALAIAALVGFVLEVLFIAGHTGWRGGWTVGPRYIITVAPVLGLWAVEALESPALGALGAVLGAASIAATGYAAALYPHLSDVYTNPLVTFLWPSYRRGASTYGLADSLGLTGSGANLVHLVPLTLALFVAALAGSRSLARRAALVVVVLGVFLGGMTRIPELDPDAAQRENDRLWGFWEPPIPARAPEPEAMVPARPGFDPARFLARARDVWQTVNVEAIFRDGTMRVPCRGLGDPRRCTYGGQPWQVFGPDVVTLAEQREPLLVMHPIADWIVRASLRVPPEARQAILRYGLSDASVRSDNKSPVEVRVVSRGRELAHLSAENRPGLFALPLTLSATTAQLSVEIRCDKDGARNFAFDVELYR
jgi:hypothetical protein